jgi:hypothetical protein
LQDLRPILAAEKTLLSDTHYTAPPKSFLEKVSINDLSQRESSLKSYKNPGTLEPMYGEFRGTIRFLIGKRKNGRLIIIIKEASETQKQPSIRIDVIDGVNPKTTHIGGINQLKRLTDGSNGYFIESSDRSYVQFYMGDLGMQMIGNFYEKNTLGQYERSGVFRLSRVPE